MNKKVTQNVTNSNFEDLTEFYQKGKLPKGYYYLKKPDGKVMIITPSLRFMVDGYSILAEVPSYEEFQEFKNANDSMFDTIKMLNKDNNKLEKENTKLKELLKDSREILYVEEMVSGNPRYIDELRILIKRINQVLGEE